MWCVWDDAIAVMMMTMIVAVFPTGAAGNGSVWGVERY